MQDRAYKFSREQRSILESLQIPLAAYQFVGGKVITLLVSDGMCEFEGLSRHELTDGFNTSMFQFVHPDDVGALAKLGLRYATKEGPYDIVYRSLIPGTKEYRYIHAVSRFQSMEDGSRVAFTHYADLSGSMKQSELNAMEIGTPLARFLDEGADPMAVVTRDTWKLLYFNKAIVRLLKPAVTYDSGMTFQEYFCVDDPKTMQQLTANVDCGLHILPEIRSGRRIGVNIISTEWEDGPAYVIYCYEMTVNDPGVVREQSLRLRQISFNKMIFSGVSNKQRYEDPSYHGFWIWNLSDDALIQDEFHPEIHERIGNVFTLSQLCRFIMPMMADERDRAFAEHFSSAMLTEQFESGSWPHSRQITYHLRHGRVTIYYEFTIIRSPDDGRLYLKIQEQNVTKRVVAEAMIARTVTEEYDCVVYVDARADQCRVFLRSDSREQQDFSVSLTDYHHFLSEQFGFGSLTREQLLERIKAECETESSHHHVFELPGGNIKSVSCTYIDRESQVYFLTCRDVTLLLRRERLREAELRSANEAASQAERDKDAFIARTSHDLRTPLSAVISLSEFGLRDAADQAIHHYFHEINANGTYMLGMLNDLLDIEKFSSGGLELNPQPADLRELFDQICSMVRARAESKQISLQISPSIEKSADSFCVIDSQRVRQILVNILTNAVKYTPEGGTVTWDGHADAMADGRPCFVHVISDTGVGISAQFMKHMFEPYAREENALSARESGTGLGLAIVKSLMDSMHGTIEVSSEIGRGTSFTLRIPYRRASAEEIRAYQAEHQAAAGRDYHLEGLKALVCDDREINREILSRILQEAGLSSDSAADGAEGCRLEAASHYDVILMDVMMPVMDGLQAARRIRDRNPDVPIIALSANAYPADIQRSLDAGMNAHLTKPIDAKALYQAIARLVHSSPE